MSQDSGIHRNSSTAPAPPPSGPGAPLSAYPAAKRLVAFDVARAVADRMQARVSGLSRERPNGYRVIVRCDDGQAVCRDVRVDEYLVLGTHQRCDLALDDDPGMRLSGRHMVAACLRGDDGVGLRLVDLHTYVPFFFGDNEQSSRSMFALGNFVACVGRNVICGYAVQLGRGETDGRPPESGCISGPNGGDTRINLTHRAKGLGTSIVVPAAELARGIVLGRGLPFLPADALRVLEDVRVSRAHLLLLRQGSEVFAFDLSTPNGTRVDGLRFQRLRVPARGAILDLGGVVDVTINQEGSP
jgi:hypothetical protein